MDQFGHAPRVRVVGALHRHRPDLHRQIGDAGLFEHRLGGFGIMLIILDRVVVGPHGRRDRVLGDRARALEHHVEDRLLVDRHVESAADLRLVERRLLGVVGKIADIEALLLHHLDALGLLHRGDVGGVGIGHDVALARLQLLVAHARVGRDREDQVLDLGRLAPIVVEAREADHRVLLVGDEAERSGADRLLVQHFGVVLDALGVFGRKDRGEVHRHVGDEGRLGTGQRELDGVVVDLLDALDEIGHRHALVIFPGAAGGLVEGVVLVALTLEREDHVIGVEVARRRELVVGVEFHALTKVEGDLGAVLGHVPALGEAGDHFGGAGLELGEVVVDRVRRGVEGGAGGIKRGVEALGAAFRAIDEVLRLRGAREGKGGRACGEPCLYLHVVLPDCPAIPAREVTAGRCVVTAGCPSGPRRVGLELFMKKEKIIAHVDPDLRDLIPGYLKNRQKDITTIKKALKAADFAKIRVLGHSMKGSGGG